jgi:mannitol-1-phosphate/altronate dehydrogenase
LSKTLVCFGFGPIASGLFVYEACRSGNFDRYVVAEVDAGLVEAIRAAAGRYTVNIAHAQGVEQFTLDGLELLNPADEADREALLQAISESDEMATCLPSVEFYDRGQAGVAALLAQGISRRRREIPTIIYAAENHNHAAEILSERIAAHLGDAPTGLQALNTVIGKMSGVIREPEVMDRLDLAPIVAGFDRAILIEEFNRILISRAGLDDHQRGITVFEEKDDLLPFEEAKLYGHNAIHALIAYLADYRRLDTIAQAADHPDIMACAREAFLGESGQALIARHGKLADPLFTPAGYESYADDLLNRMVNPYLNDLVSRVGRDHRRKLGFSDRLYGTMRLALRAGIEPTHLARGAAAGVVSMVRRRDELAEPPEVLPTSEAQLDRPTLAWLLGQIWGDQAQAEPEMAEALIDLTAAGLAALRERF